MSGFDLDPEKVTDQQYEIPAARRQNYDAMMWQTPALSLTAQAFLFTIALGDGARIGRLLASTLALVVSLASAQLLAKHRHFETQYSMLLERVERGKGWQRVHQPLPRAKAFLIARSSFVLWLGLLLLFGGAAIAAFGLALIDA